MNVTKDFMFTALIPQYNKFHKIHSFVNNAYTKNSSKSRECNGKESRF